MDIKDKISPEDKAMIGNLMLERELLTNLLGERNSIIGKKIEEILAKNGLSPNLYNLKFNPSLDLWEAELKQGALIIPNRETRRALERRKN